MNTDLSRPVGLFTPRAPSIAKPAFEAAPPPSRTQSVAGVANIAAFWGVHAACLAAFWTGVDTRAVLMAVALYVVRMFGITAGYHRYFSHHTYRMGRVMQFLIGWLGCMSAQKGPLWWAAHHRRHHQYSDTRSDIHSPIRESFWWSHVGWVLSSRYDDTDYRVIPDFTKFPELMWLNRWHLVPPLTLGIACLLFGGAKGLVWGFFISTTVLWHSTFLINSAAHLFGSQRYPTTDASRNNVWLAFLTLGEGWHNNHHYHPSSTGQGFFWWEIDLSLYGLKVLEKLGLVSDLRRPPERVLALGRENDRRRRLAR